jgi:hypothetical protein
LGRASSGACAELLVQTFVRSEQKGRTKVAATKKIVVQKRDDGKFEGKRPGGERASVVRDTQHETIDASREVLRKSGGGELAVRRIADGQIRKQDTVEPGNDPRRSPG